MFEPSTPNGATVPPRDTVTYHHMGEIDLGRGSIPVDEETATGLIPSTS